MLWNSDLTHPLCEFMGVLTHPMAIIKTNDYVQTIFNY